MQTSRKEAWFNTDLSFGERAHALVDAMTVDEKISQMLHESPGIERLGVPEYNWWNECLHGVGRAGIATVFPQAIALAACWDAEFHHRVAVAVSDEARAKHHEALRKGGRGQYMGLTFWTPNINIFRDPRWGRGQETYGEDPYLTARLGVEFVKGLQGDDAVYLKLSATAKHFAVHSGPESMRHEFDVRPTPKDLNETYLPAFKACVQEGRVESVMTAYNKIYGEPCSSSTLLMQQILREEWGFCGHVVSDCGAVEDIYQSHHKVACGCAASARAVRAGCDLCCGKAYEELNKALAAGAITEEEIDTALIRLFTTRMKLGMFDPVERVPFAQIPCSVVDSPEHRRLARDAAAKSMVLLKNAGILPLKGISGLAVIGPAADSLEVLLGNYNGTPSSYTTLLSGIKARAEQEGISLYYAEGCGFTAETENGLSDAVSAAQDSDAIILCLGLNPLMEGEEGDAYNADASGDRLDISLPPIQEALLKEVCAQGKPVVLLVTGGSAISLEAAHNLCSAVVYVWYPGEEGGSAVADVLFGDCSPAGRLPVTIVRSLKDLPSFDDYSMEGRTYRYFKGSPLYPFGFGLSYSRFEYSNLSLPQEIPTGQDLRISLSVTNTGGIEADEVAELYLSCLDAPVPVPICQLAAFTRIHLMPGETREVALTVSSDQLGYIDMDGRHVLLPASYMATAGGSQGDTRSMELGASTVLTKHFRTI